MKNSSNSPKGIVTYLTIALIAFISLSLSNVWILNQGEVTQMAKSEALLKADLVSRGYFQVFVWKLKSAPFDQRPCAAKAWSDTVTRDGFTCELLCYDAEDEDKALDIWLVTKSNLATRSIFYRVKYVESLVNRYNTVLPIYSAFYQIDDVPTSKTSPKTPQKILDVLKKQRENMKGVPALVKAIEGTSNIREVLQKIGAFIPQDAISVPPPMSGNAQAQAAQTGNADSALQLSNLLSINSLKKTDNAIQLALAQNAAHNTGGNGQPDPTAVAVQHQSMPDNDAAQNGNVVPQNQQAQQPQNPPIVTAQSGPQPQNGGINGQPAQQPPPPQTGTGGQGNTGPKPVPPPAENKRGTFLQRFSTSLQAWKDNLKFGIKELLGKATPEDAAKAKASLDAYNAVATQGSITQTLLNGYNNLNNFFFNNNKGK